MRWQSIVGLVLIAGSIYIGRDLMMDSEHPWPAYAEPQATCGSELSGVHQGAAVKFRYPAGWHVGERQDKITGIVQTFLAPADRGPEVTVFLREAQVRSPIVTVPAPSPASPRPGVPSRTPPKLRDAPASTPEAAVGAPAPLIAEPAGPVRLSDTDQSLAYDGQRHGNAYLSRQEEGEQKVSYSWMAFVWDSEGRMIAVSGPKLFHSNWPPQRQRNRRINCGFWETLKTLEPK